MTLSHQCVADAVVPGLAISRATHAEASRLAQTEYERVLALLRQLSGADWSQPTYCTEWTVRDMTAHLAGAVTGSSSFAEFRHQNLHNPYLKEFADPVDGTNKLQLEERAGKSSAELVEEFRVNGQLAVDNRRRLPWLVRKIHLPMGSLGFTTVEYLMDVIYPRDQWMHRYDICAATGREMTVTPEHDGRIVALVVRDLARKLRKLPDARTIDLRLGGALEAAYRFGSGKDAAALVEMDFLDFNLLASGRIGAADVANRLTIRGDHDAAEWFLRNCSVVY